MKAQKAQNRHDSISIITGASARSSLTTVVVATTTTSNPLGHAEDDVSATEVTEDNEWHIIIVFTQLCLVDFSILRNFMESFTTLGVLAYMNLFIFCNLSSKKRRQNLRLQKL